MAAWVQGIILWYAPEMSNRLNTSPGDLRFQQRDEQRFNNFVWMLGVEKTVLGVEFWYCWGAQYLLWCQETENNIVILYCEIYVKDFVRFILCCVNFTGPLGTQNFG